jgi:nucleoid DNA-binding protein
MIPKKANSLYKEIVEEFDISEDLLESLIENYYKTLRKKMSNLTDLRLNVDGLGHFVVKVQKVKKAIPHYKKVLDNHDTSTFGAYHNKKSVEEKLELLNKIDIKAEEELLKRKTFKDEKYTKTDLAESKTDSGGDNQ